MKNVVFFNNKGGVGKTTFTYHLGFALERMGKKVLLLMLIHSATCQATCVTMQL